MPYKRWQYLEKVASADFQSYLQDQVVAVFTSTTQRDAQITAPIQGMQCYVNGIGMMVYNGTTWQYPNGHYALRATRSTAFSFGTAAVFVYNVIGQDPSNSYNTSNGLYTCKLDGYYLVIASAGGAFTANQVFNSYVYKSGSQFATNNNAAAVNGTFVIACTAMVPCVAGDTLAGGIGGPAVTGNVQTTLTFFEVAYLGALV